MDIKPELTPRQEYALTRISEIINNHNYRKISRKRASWGMVKIVAVALLGCVFGFTFNPNVTANSASSPGEDEANSVTANSEPVAASITQ